MEWCNLISHELEHYAYTHSLSCEHIEAHRRWTEELVGIGSQWLIPRSQGAFLAMLVSITGAKNIFEIGCFTGYSTMWLNENLPLNGHIITCDINENFVECVDKLVPNVDAVVERGQDLVRGLRDIDLVFIDGWKEEYKEYYEATLPALASGGIMIFDNTLWRGDVLRRSDETGKILDDFNKMIALDNRVTNTLIPTWDGLTVVQKCR